MFNFIKNTDKKQFQLLFDHNENTLKLKKNAFYIYRGFT